MSVKNPVPGKDGNRYIPFEERTGESSVVFSDGEAIIVPVRMRKPLREALAAYLSE